jgi:hypothetical protein
MNLLLVVEEGRGRRWIRRLVDRLGELGAKVRLATVPAVDAPARGVDLLLELERMVMRRQRAAGAEPIPTDAIAPTADAGFTPDLVVDLGSMPRARADARVFAVSWDGVHGETAAIERLVAGSTPLCEVVDPETGEVYERGLASLETASGLGGAIDAVTARLTTLLVARIEAMRDGRDRPSPAVVPRLGAAPPRHVARLAATSFAGSLARAFYRLCCHAPHWRVGWRLHDGPGIAETGDLSGPAFQVMPDPGHRFFADPFPITREGRTYVFVEDLDHRVGKGLISVLPFDANGPSGEPVVVLEEPWHLSYPYLIEHDGELWMIPESSNASDVALYRCTRFPDRWERAATLLDGLALSDATVFEDGGRWWMMGTLHDGDGGWSDVLALYSAPSLFGPWTAHPGNPVMIDRTAARPAGAPFRRDGRLFRPVQDCSDGYGSALAIAEITRLDDSGFTQEVRHRLAPGPRWPGRKLHTLNRCGRLEVIDGSVVRPKWSWLAGFVERATTPEGAR